ncbi:hypothetical protein [Streptomyces lunaelactis]|uniref:hypothetical protein n=1 Tax=Streptomyces lunaelactis TaxID=1535768 RepID=UPI0015853A03|nr:hypothetical protein [Streptomyces lunaelactis]NUK02221.1 hypothetical protein [Streptomyces lunaelactis]NUK15591.1 hypothetical protein [Streptomyces lunaelactis]
MSASERESQPRPQYAEPAQPVTQPSALSMRDLLASCAAASAVSTPPREERRAEELRAEEREPRRDAA